MTEARKAVNHLRYFITVALVLFGRLVRIWPLALLGSELTWVTFFPAVGLSSLIGGIRTGLLATALSILAVIFWAPPSGTFMLDLPDWIGVVVFAIDGLGISIMAEVMRKSKQNALAALQRQELVEIELKQNNDFQKLIMENITDGLFVSHTLEQHPYIIFSVWNYKMTEITGYTIEEINSLGWYNSLFPDPQQQRQIIQRMADVRAGNNLVGEVLEIMSKYGEKKVIYISTSLIHDIDGSLHILALIEDITSKMKAKNDLLRASSVIEQSPIMVVITNTSAEVEYVNRTFTESTGYTLDELSGKKHVIFKSSKVTTHDGYETMWNELTIGRQWRGELNITRKDGMEISVSVKALPLRDADGAVTHYVRLAEDITDLRRLENELRQSQKMDAVGQLAGGVAHDFNNILSTIKNYAYILKTSLNKDDELLLSFVDHIQDSTDKAAYLTQSLLGFSRKLVINLRPVNLVAIVAGIRSLFDSFIREDINVQFLLSDSAVMVSADGVQLEMVLINLVNNAMDAMPNGGALTIKLDTTTIDTQFVARHSYGVCGEYARICVSDNGMGMDAVTRERIFEPFFTTKELGKGTGLGLATVYGIVKQHNGYINVYSEVGEGSTFTILLPFIESTEDTNAIIKPAPIKGTGETILLAEDNEEMRNSISTLLQKAGYKVIEAVDGIDAIVKFGDNASEIGIVLLDVVMPRANGKVVYERIREGGSTVKVIFLSGYSYEIIKQQDIAELVVDYVQKPVDPVLLLDKIREVIDR
ncbi:MAG: PAS domain S-box protein [Candidatus Magnetominusculus sp. LBB02]|nr:PAS domain S-box protein [Candidatus Magnetominusculus sp. LBB02]